MSLCPLRSDGVHDMTASPKCACGYELQIPRFGYSLTVHDNQTKGEAVDDCFMTNSAENIAEALGGACIASNLVTLCPWLHRRGPESIHGKQVKVEAETERGAFGPLSFWRQTGEFDDLGQPTYYLVKREIRPFEYERD